MTGLIESGKARERQMRDQGGRGGGAIQGCGGAIGVAAGEYPIPASMHDHLSAPKGTR